MKSTDTDGQQRDVSARQHLVTLQEGMVQGLQILDELKLEHERIQNEMAALRVRLKTGATGTEMERAIQALSVRMERVGVLLSQGESVAERSGPAMSAISRTVREMGMRLETAQQGRGLGLHAIRVQEEERRHLAREIHDGPAQLLNSVVLRIDVCQRLAGQDPDRLKHELTQLKDLVRLSIQDVRKIIFDLRPMALDDLGLVPALRQYMKDYQSRTGIETDFAFYGNDRRYNPAFEVALFRLCQEALTNVAKHAGATRVWVTVETTGGQEIKLSVKDDGVGFDPEQVKPGNGGSKFGLVGMRERAELLSGSMEVQSAPGRGAKLTFVLPLVD
ncbi:MAG: sensor histidine kinase [Bacillota bacterium]